MPSNFLIVRVGVLNIVPPRQIPPPLMHNSPPGYVNKRVVRILLECILVENDFWEYFCYLKSLQCFSVTSLKRRSGFAYQVRRHNHIFALRNKIHKKSQPGICIIPSRAPLLGARIHPCRPLNTQVTWLHILRSSNMSHFAYACKMRYPLNLVLENSEYLWFYWTFCIVILDYGLKLHKLSNHTLVMLQKWLEIH